VKKISIYQFVENVIINYNFENEKLILNLYYNIIMGNPELVWVVPKGVRLSIHRRKSNYASSTPALSIFYFFN